MKVNFQPFGSAYVISQSKAQQIKEKRITKEHIPFYDSEITLKPDKIGFYFEGENPGTIFNTFEKVTLNSVWDVREDQDFSTVILGRNHMFYTADGVPIAYTNEYGRQDNDLNVKISGPSCIPLDFLNIVNHHLVNTLKKEELYDDATFMEYKFGESNVETNSLKKNLNRDNVRKFSENHFVISGYNLLFQEIKVDNNVINTVVPSGDFSWFSFTTENTILSLFDVTKNQNKQADSEYFNNLIVSQKVEIPKFLFDGCGELDEKSLSLIVEYLSNYLLKQVEYCYTGKIFMKYNPKIEIGDTITLLDETSSTYGVFRVDSFEHSLDTRGLITVANVKAVWDFKDPLLDTFATKIGNDLLSDLGKLVEREPTVDANGSSKVSFPPKNKTIQNIMEVYLKYLVQSPKYTMLFHANTGIIFDELSIIHNNSLTPTPMPLRFMPMFVKGKIQMPENLKCVFFNSPAHNYTSFLSSFYISFMIGLNKSWFSISNVLEKGVALTVDFLLSVFTIGLHELFKPLLGITKRKAIESTFSQSVNVVDGEIESMQSYNPYTGSIGNNKEFSICFFNIQMMKTSEISGNDDCIDKAILLKEEFTNHLINEKNFNGLLLVELYDSFVHNSYTYKDFISKFNTDYTAVRDGKNISYGAGSPFELNKTEFSTEYGASIFNQDKNQRYNISSKTISISGVDRNVIETIIEYREKIKKESGYKRTTNSELVYEGNKAVPDKYKIIWFHNLYGKDLYSIEKRKKNIELILNYYTDEYNKLVNEAKEPDYGYIIMADCNLQVVKNQDEVILTSNGGKNEFYRMNSNMPFTQLIKQATTLSKDGIVESNLFDNVLVSDNAKGFVTASRVVSAKYSDSLNLISDHIPVLARIKFKP